MSVTSKKSKHMHLSSTTETQVQRTEREATQSLPLLTKLDWH